MATANTQVQVRVIDEELQDDKRASREYTRLKRECIFVFILIHTDRLSMGF